MAKKNVRVKGYDTSFITNPGVDVWVVTAKCPFDRCDNDKNKWFRAENENMAPAQAQVRKELESHLDKVHRK